MSEDISVSAVCVHISSSVYGFHSKSCLHDYLCYYRGDINGSPKAFCTGSKLLTGGELIQIWQLTPDKGGQGDTETEEPGTKRVHFSLGDSSIAGSGDPEEDAFTQRLSHVLDPAHHGLAHDPGTWQCVWKCR